MERRVNCEEARNLITIGIYGRLTGDEEERLARHLETCRLCSAAYEKTRAYINVLEEDSEVPAPDWDKSWEMIRRRARRRERGLSVFLPYRKIAMAGAALAAVFVLGFFLGRHLLAPHPPESLDPSYANYRSVAVADYSERVDMLLVNFLNRSDGGVPEGFRALEREVISDMLAETRLLRLLAERRGDRPRYDVLEDVEMVLIDLSNLEPEDEDSADRVDRVIRDKDLRLQLRNLVDLKSTI